MEIYFRDNYELCRISFKTQGKAFFLQSRGFENVYRSFHVFEQAKFAYDGLVLGSSQFSRMPRMPQKGCSFQKWSKLTQK